MEQTRSTKSQNNRRRRRGSSAKVAEEIKSSFLKGKPSQIPTPIEVENKKAGVVYWGNDNLYPYFLNYLYRNNSMHSGIISAKRYFTVSGGLKYEGPDQEAWEEFFNNGKKNHRDQDLDELIWHTSLNFEKSNMFCFKIIRSSLGDRKIRKMVEIPFEKIRFEFEEEDKRVILTGNIKVSEDWSDSKASRNVLMPYDPKDETQKVFYVLFQEESGQSLDEANAVDINPSIYPAPPYAGAITDIETGIQIAKYNNSEIHNGFSLGTVLNLNNGPIKDEGKKKRFEKDLQEASSGAYQAGGTMILYNNGKNREASVVNLNGNNLPDRYQNSKKSSEESIIHGHSITTPILFGVKTEGSLGNATELQVGYSIMKANYFQARQRAILSVLNWIAKEIQGLQGEIGFNEVKLELESNVGDSIDPVAEGLNNLSDLVANKAMENMTPNEIRKLANLPPLPGGDTLPNSGGFKKSFSQEDEDKIIERFKQRGRSKSEFKILGSYSIDDLDQISNQQAIDKFQKERFQNLTNLQAQALNLISQGNGFDTIRKALDISSAETARIYQVLILEGLISNDGQLSQAGALAVAGAEIERMEVLFEYRKRPEVKGPPILPRKEDGKRRTREFCETLLNLDRLYTREEIDQISGTEGYDVFRHKGGWWHNEGVNEPQCRHEWAQVVTFI